MVRESVEHLKMAGKEVMLDLEHFFDGWKANREYTMQVLSRSVGLGMAPVPRLVVVCCCCTGAVLVHSTTVACFDWRISPWLFCM